MAHIRKGRAALKQRQADAQARAEARAKRSNVEQIASLDARKMRALKERQRLSK